MTTSKPCSFDRDAEGSEKALRTTEDRGMTKKEAETVTRTTEDQKMEPCLYRVLVVDDEAPMRELIVRLLSGKGHRCTTACNGLEALDKVREEKIDAVVTDIVMPEMDGITLTRELSTGRHSFPVMVLTGHSNEYSEESALAAGAREFIRKPFSIDEFILRFHRMMQDHEALLQTEARTYRTIWSLRQVYIEKVREAEREAEKLRARLYSSYADRNDY